MRQATKNLVVRTQLCAGLNLPESICMPHDTNCIARDLMGRDRADIFNTCNRGKPFAGTDCTLMVTQQRFKGLGLNCFKC